MVNKIMLRSWTGKYTCGDSPMEHLIGPLVIPDSEICAVIQLAY